MALCLSGPNAGISIAVMTVFSFFLVLLFLWDIFVLTILSSCHLRVAIFPDNS
uniref:Uncharacterized protein n=1 Tax=Rhizophora mucronata TaxID=61149 RepID=A0A2P2MV89_RHIMU